MQSATTPGSRHGSQHRSPQSEITVHDTVSKVTQLLDMAGEELTSAQQAVADCMRNSALTSAEICRLQKLDLATQTVASAATVLKNLMSLSPIGITDTLNVASLAKGVTLSEVVQVLKGEDGSGQSMGTGEMDLF